MLSFLKRKQKSVKDTDLRRKPFKVYLSEFEMEEVWTLAHKREKPASAVIRDLIGEAAYREVPEVFEEGMRDLCDIDEFGNRI
jgi:hypothetical protein